MSIVEIKQQATQKMQQSLDSFQHSLTKIRTGRANPGLLDTVHVDYYGSMVPISQVANVALLDARTISVSPWEKGMGAKIEKAIRDSYLGLNPASQGDMLKASMPRWPSVICAVMPMTASRNWSRKNWLPKTTSAARKMKCRNLPTVLLMM